RKHGLGLFAACGFGRDLVDREAPQIQSVRRFVVRTGIHGRKWISSMRPAGEPLVSPRSRFESRERGGFEGPPLGMPHMVGAPTQRPSAPPIQDLDRDRVVNADVWMQAMRRRPRPEAY